MGRKATTDSSMATSVFVDSGAFIARANPGDQHHLEARSGWDKLAASDAFLLSSEPVLVEAANFIARSQGGRFASSWLARHLDSKEIRWLQPGPREFEQAAADLARFSDQRVSLTDALSFALMREHKVSKVFGFDRHFAMAGFSLWPETTAL